MILSEKYCAICKKLMIREPDAWNWERVKYCDSCRLKANSNRQKLGKLAKI